MALHLNLSSSARLAFIGLTYLYIVKFIDTWWHGIFIHPAISFVVVCLSILAGITQFLFFYTLKFLTSNSGVVAHMAGWTGVIGTSINILPKMLALSVLLQYYFSLNLIMNGQLIALLSPWLGAVMIFCCCLIFSLIAVKMWSSKTRYFLLGAIGYLNLTVTFSMLVLNVLSGVQVNWQEGEIGTSPAYFIISASFSFLCLTYFYSGFFSGNEIIECDKNR